MSVEHKELVQSGRIDQALMNEVDVVVSGFSGVSDNAIGEMIGATHPARCTCS
ncbi:hypothetical protein [Saccharothrix sp. NRRL B-16314]|uniref:hypothetical protein n=1 Tax=Saccharothrix sp. NRRL B-16314 TaxID=1463825 RepID=UPI000A81FE49|nr:hypothetical protein [Saccharothrix sp. NRRL B-16314]